MTPQKRSCRGRIRHAAPRIGGFAVEPQDAPNRHRRQDGPGRISRTLGGALSTDGEPMDSLAAVEARERTASFINCSSRSFTQVAGRAGFRTPGSRLKSGSNRIRQDALARRAARRSGAVLSPRGAACRCSVDRHRGPSSATRAKSVAMRSLPSTASICSILTLSGGRLLERCKSGVQWQLA